MKNEQERSPSQPEALARDCVASDRPPLQTSLWSRGGVDVGCVKWPLLPVQIELASQSSFLLQLPFAPKAAMEHTGSVVGSLNSAIVPNTSTPHPRPLSPKRGEGSRVLKRGAPRLKNTEIISGQFPRK